METERTPDLRLFFDILRTLDRIDAPYMIIGGFAAAIYGNTRTTYDIDIVVDLKEHHIQALVAAYPAPRYYADPMQMRNSIRRGISLNIVAACSIPMEPENEMHRAVAEALSVYPDCCCPLLPHADIGATRCSLAIVAESPEFVDALRQHERARKAGALLIESKQLPAQLRGADAHQY